MSSPTFSNGPASTGAVSAVFLTETGTILAGGAPMIADVVFSTFSLSNGQLAQSPNNVVLASGTLSNQNTTSYSNGTSGSIVLTPNTTYWLSVKLTTEPTVNYMSGSTMTFAAVPGSATAVGGQAFLAGSISTGMVGVSWSSGSALGGWNPAANQPYGNTLGTLYYVVLSTCPDIAKVDSSNDCPFQANISTYAQFGYIPTGRLGDPTYLTAPPLPPSTTFHFYVKARHQGAPSINQYTAYNYFGSTQTWAAVPSSVTTTAGVGISTSFFNLTANSVGVAWASGTASGGYNPSGTQYDIRLSTWNDPTFGGTFVNSGQTVALSTSPIAGGIVAPEGSVSGLASNTEYFFYIRALNNNLTPVITAWTFLGSTRTLAAATVASLSTPTFTGGSITTGSFTTLWNEAGGGAAGPFSGGGVTYTTAVVVLTTFTLNSFPISPNNAILSSGTVVNNTTAYSNVMPVVGNSGSFLTLSVNTTYWVSVKLSTETDSNYVSGATVTLAVPISTNGVSTPIPFGSLAITSAGISWHKENNPFDVTTYDLRFSTWSDTAMNSFASAAGTVKLTTTTASQSGQQQGVITGLTPATSYYYYGRALNRSIAPVPTEWAFLGQAVTLAVSPDTATTISGQVVFTTVSANAVTVQWSSGTGSVGYNPSGTKYELHFSTWFDPLSTSFAWANDTVRYSTSPIASAGTLPMARVAGLLQNTSYYFYGRAVNNNYYVSSWRFFGSTFTPSGITPQAFTAVSPSGFTANWASELSTTTVYSAAVSTNPGYPNTAPGNQYFSTTSVFVQFSNLNANTLYYGFVSPNGQAPYTSLGSVTTNNPPPPTVGFNFTGSNFNPPGNVISANNQQNVWGEAVVVDTVTAGNPVYVLFGTTTGPAGSTPAAFGLAKYSQAGVFQSSVALGNSNNHAVMAVDNQGNVYVGETADTFNTKLTKFSSQMIFATSRTADTNGAFRSIVNMVSDGTNIYTAHSGVTGGAGPARAAKLIKYNGSLVALATATYSIGGNDVKARGLVLDEIGQPHMLVSSETTGAPIHLIKYGSNFDAASTLADVVVDTTDFKHPMSGELACAFGKTFVAFIGANNTKYLIREFNSTLNYTGVTATFSVVGPSPTNAGPSLRAGQDGSIILGGVANLNNGDMVLVKYAADNNLNFLSSVAFSGSNGFADEVVGMMVYGQSSVFVTGVSSLTAAQANALTLKLDMGVGGGFGGSNGTLTVPSVPFTGVTTNTLTANWLSTFQTGTSYYVRLSTDATFPNNAPNNLVSTTTALSATFTGLSSSTLYTACVSTNSFFPPIPITKLLGSIMTYSGSAPSINGTLTYAGKAQGPIIMQAYTTPSLAGAPSATGTFTNQASQTYFLPVAANTNYYVRAFVDSLLVGATSSPQSWQDQGTYNAISTPTLVYVYSGSTTNINFAISVDTIAPAPPSGLVATPSGGQVQVSWAPPSVNADGTALSDLRGYIVERSTNSAGPFVSIAGAAATPLPKSGPNNFFDFSPVPNQANHYRVLAVDYGQNKSAPSSPVSASAQATASGGTINGSMSTFTITNSGTFRIRLQAAPQANGPYIQELTQTPFSFTGVSSGTYYLRAFRDVNSQNSAGNLDPQGTFGGFNSPYPIYIFGGNVTYGSVTLCDRSLLQPGTPANGSLTAGGCPALDAGPDRTTSLYAFGVADGSPGAVALNSNLIISLSSITSAAAASAFDSDLIVIGPYGNVVARNSQPGGSAVNFVVTQPGVYLVEPTSFLPGIYGSFTLKMSAVSNTGSGKLSGCLGYPGGQTGTNFAIRFFDNANYGGLSLSTRTVAKSGSNPYCFSFTDLPTGTFFMDAFLDTDGRGFFNPAYHAYGKLSSGSPITITASTQTIAPSTATLADPGSADLGNLSLSGEFRYNGSSSFPGAGVRAALFQSGSKFPIRLSSAPYAATSSYFFGDLSSGTYFVRGFIDANSNFVQDANEPIAFSSAAGTFMTASRSGQNYSFCDRQALAVGTPVNGTLTYGDCTSPDHNGSLAKLYTFSGARGTPMTIQMDSTDLYFYGTFLALYDPEGNLVAVDAGSAGNGNARITNFILPTDGIYTIAAAAQAVNVTGSYRLTTAGSSGQLGSIAGEISYSGSQGGRIFVGLFNSPNFSSGTSVAGQILIGTTTFTFPSLQSGTSYYLGAFVDFNYNSLPDSGEDKGLFGTAGSASPINLQNGQNLTGVNIVLQAQTFGSQGYISGLISYAGSVTGSVRVEFWPNNAFTGTPVALRTLASTGTYDASLPSNVPYYLRAFTDVNNNLFPDPNEPRGVYAPNSQGAEPVFVSSGTTFVNINITLRDPGLVTAPGGGVAGVGTASLALSSVAAGSFVRMKILYFTDVSSGINAGGRVGFAMPPGFGFPLNVTALDIKNNANLTSGITFPAPGVVLTTVTPNALINGASIQFVFDTVAPCVPQTATFTVVAAQNAGVVPQPLFQGSPYLTVSTGPVMFFAPAKPYFSVQEGQISEAQYLTAQDSCRNVVPSTGPVTIEMRSKTFDFVSGQFKADSLVGISSATNLSTSSTLNLDFAVNQSSQAFYILSTSTGPKNIEIYYSLGVKTTSYYGLSVLSGGGISRVSVSSYSFGVNQTSVTITPNSDPTKPNQAYINFNLAQPNTPWHILIASVPFIAGATPGAVWESWGYGQPTLGQIAWNGRYSPWLNGGVRVPNGLYFVRVEVAGGVSNDTLRVIVSASQVAGQVLDNGLTPNPPVPDAAIKVYGPFGSLGTTSDSLGNYTLPGAAAGTAYNASLKAVGYLDAAASFVLNAAGSISSFTAQSASVLVSTTSSGALDFLMTRAPLLTVSLSSLTVNAANQTVVLSTSSVHRWGSILVQGSAANSTQMNATLNMRLPASSATFDDGGQWDSSLQQFVAKTLFSIPVTVGTYTVTASLTGFQNSTASVYVPLAGASLSMPAFPTLGSISGVISVPSNPNGAFVSVNAVNTSTAASATGGSGGLTLGPGVLQGTYTVAGLAAGSYRLRALMQGLAPLATGPITVPVSSAVTNVDFAALSAGAVISGTATVSAATTGNGLVLFVNAWSPTSQSFISTTVFAAGGVAGLTVNYSLPGLLSNTTYLVYADLHAGAVNFDLTQNLPIVHYATASSNNLNFTFAASSGAVAGTLLLPAGQLDFGKVQMNGRVVSSLRASQVGDTFSFASSTNLPNFTCVPANAAPNAATGNCPAGSSTATFSATGLGTETTDISFFYKTGGQAQTKRVSIVNGSTTTVLFDLSPATYTISGQILNQIVNATLFNTNPNIFSNAPELPLLDAAGAAVFIDTTGVSFSIPRSTGSLARVVAIKQNITAYNTAISTAFDPVTSRVGYLTQAGTYTISNVPAGVYWVRTADLRTCTTCPVVVPGAGQTVRISSASRFGVDFTLSDGFTVTGGITLAEDILDAQTFDVVVTNARQEVVQSTVVYLGNAALGVTANSASYQFDNLPAGQFYTVAVKGASYAGKPVRFPNQAVSPTGLQADIADQNVLMQRAAFISGQLRDANTGIAIDASNATWLAPNFAIFAKANPWVEGGYVTAASSVSGRPIQTDGTFIVGPLLPDVSYDLKLTQTNWDPTFLVFGSQNYAPVTISNLTPQPGETRNVGVVSLSQGQSLNGVVRANFSTGPAVGNIKITATPSFGVNSELVVQTYSNGQGAFTLWVSSAVANQYDVTAAPPDGNTDTSGKIYGMKTLKSVSLLTGTTADFVLTPLVVSATGQVNTADGGELNYPFGDKKGFLAAAVNLQKIGTVAASDPLGDIKAATDEKGQFSLTNVSTGNYTLRATSLGYAIYKATMAITTTGSTIFTGVNTAVPGNVIILQKGASVSGTILKSDGSAPNDSELGGVIAANFKQGEFVVGTLDVDPIAKAVGSYSMTGFKTGISYDLVLLPADKGDLPILPSEGAGITFGTDESTTTKTVNLTMITPPADCSAKSKGLGSGKFQVKISCSKALRKQVSADDNLDVLVTTSVLTSSGTTLSSPDGTGDFVSASKVMSQNRKQITLVYQSKNSATPPETKFSLRLTAVASDVDPKTGANFPIDKIFDFYAGLDSDSGNNTSNAQGGSIGLEPSALDEASGIGEGGGLAVAPGTFAEGADDNSAVVVTSQSVKIKMSKGKTESLAKTLSLASLGFIPNDIKILSNPAAFPGEMAEAMKAYKALASTDTVGGAKLLSSFYSIFLPATIRHQLKQNAALTLSYSLATATSTNPDSINVWYYDPSIGQYVVESKDRSLDTVNQTITVTVNHLSSFVALDGAPLVTAATTFATTDILAANFPNPADCILHTNIQRNTELFGSAGIFAPFQGTMIRYTLPIDGANDFRDTKIKVYTVSGQLVRSIEQGTLGGAKTYYFPWACDNQSGNTVASGVYIGEINWGSRRKYFKIAIIRGSGL